MAIILKRGRQLPPDIEPEFDYLKRQLEEIFNDSRSLNSAVSAPTAYLPPTTVTPVVGTTTSAVTTSSQIKEVLPGQTLKSVQDLITDASASKRYTIFFYPGATIGAGWVASQYIDILWVGASTVDLDFQNADFTHGIRSLYNLNAIGADFSGCTITLTKAQFLDTINRWDPVTSIWTDGSAMGI